MASAQLAAKFGFQLVRRDGKWDKESPTARPENGQRLAGYVGYADNTMIDQGVLEGRMSFCAEAVRSGCVG